jgi:hypothetical protein
MEMNDIEIRDWLHSVEVYDYDICGGVVHVVGNVNLYSKSLTSIPVQFGYVSGHFYCSNKNNQLKSLEGCPSEVGGDFYCSYNELTSLKGGPMEVGGSFYCNDNDLTSLEGCPKEVGGNFNCHDNGLGSLKGCPSEVGGYFDCDRNHLKTLKGAPIEVGGHFNCDRNWFVGEPDHSHIRVGGEFLWK